MMQKGEKNSIKNGKCFNKLIEVLGCTYIKMKRI